MNINEPIVNFLNSKNVRLVFIVGAAVVVGLLLFQLGVYVGAHKANFTCHWGDNYQRNFGGPPQGTLNEVRGKEFMNAHGADGTIINIDGESIVIRGRDNREKVIATDAGTVIQQGFDILKLEDLKSNDEIVVLGSPQNDGSILAKMIRLFSTEDRFAPPPVMPHLLPLRPW